MGTSRNGKAEGGQSDEAPTAQDRSSAGSSAERGRAAREELDEAAPPGTDPLHEGP